MPGLLYPLLANAINPRNSAAGPDIKVVNGVRPSFSSMQVRPVNIPYANLPPIVEVESVEYDDEMNPRFKHLTGVMPVARTRGNYGARGSIDWGLEAFRILADYLRSVGVGGFGDIRFDIQISYAQTQNSALTTDVLRGVRIIGTQQRNAMGGKNLTTRTPLSIAQITWGTGGSELMLAATNERVAT